MTSFETILEDIFRPIVSRLSGSLSSSLSPKLRSTRKLLWLPAVTVSVWLLLVPSVNGQSSLSTQGTWILDSEEADQVIPHPDSRERGLQTSGLSYDGDYLWSIGDQRSSIPATIIRIDPKTRLVLKPYYSIRVTKESLGEIPSRLLRGNPDFEGLAVINERPRRFFAVIESDGCYVVEGILDDVRAEAQVTRVLSIRFEPEPVSGDINSRLEGIAVHDTEVWLAYERDGQGVPLLYRGHLSPTSVELTIKRVALPLENLPERENKGRVNFNGLDSLYDGSLLLAIVLRDQERLIFYRPETNAVSFVDLDFRSPDDLPIKWTSPEGIALDSEGDRLWLISDPDSQRGNYRHDHESEATGFFRTMVPLLFELRLSDLLRLATELY